jgi:hypothetical protein
MAWITPKTEWSSADRVTSDDMNRICGNLNIVYPAGKLKADYTADDIVTVSEWHEILSSLNTMLSVTGVSGAAPGDEMTNDTFNQVEELTLEIRSALETYFMQTKAASYSGETVFAGDIYVTGY